MLPFTPAQFFDLFAAYNAAVWPASVVAYGLAALALLAIAARWRWRSQAAAVVLALFWAWTGAAYHLLFFARLNPLAPLFGVLFIVQAVLFLHAGIVRRRWQVEVAAGGRAAAGLALIAYAAVAYPLIGLAAGHTYGSLPQFGVTPCPVTLFTFGLLLLSRPPLPRPLLVIPVLWSLIGGSAAVLLGVAQDWLLLVSGALVLILLRLLPPPSPAQPP